MLAQDLINDNIFLRDENKRLNNELTNYYFSVVAKANLLDVIIAKEFISQDTLNHCIAELDEIDQMEIRKAMTE